MRVMTFNANGIRAAARKGFFDWLPQQGADVVCVQETKAQIHQLQPDPVFFPRGYHVFYEDATVRKGYSGVAIYARREPDELIRGLGWDEFDAEGRYLEARFGDMAVVSFYMPSGTSGDERQAVKYRVMDAFMAHLRGLMASGRQYLICGDWNIAHKPIDLKNWKSNQKNSGFLPEERAWMDRLFGDEGYVDAFRRVDPRPERYTWWSNRGRAWDKNVGWRLDYHVATPALGGQAERAEIYTEARFSDHAPLTMDYDAAL